VPYLNAMAFPAHSGHADPSDRVSLAGLPLPVILTRRRALRRELAARPGLRPLRVAILAGSTTSELVDLLELYLLESGFAPEFYQGGFDRYYEEAVHDASALQAFRPDIVYMHTSVHNIRQFATMDATEEAFAGSIADEFGRFKTMWASLDSLLGCLIIQNNFEFPPLALLGNLDACASGGRTRFVMELNREFARALECTPKLILQDVCSLAARTGLDQWFDRERWFSYKIVTSAAGSQALALSLAALVRAACGRSRKVLVLDLDNTLWGGVIGDDGVHAIQIGRETPVAEAYMAFQQYCLQLRARGVLLAVCSKNEEAVAKSGFRHPDSVLRLHHIASFQANWNPKPENIAVIARELGLGADSFVFVDDNAAERALVAAQVEGIAVPDIGSDVTAYAGIIEAGRYFEQISLSCEDLRRAALYQENSQRAGFATKFADYGQYLDSLKMTAEIDTFQPVYLARIAQLTSKTNQFNLTTRRYTLAELEAAMRDSDCLTLYGRLEDCFGDNGLISVVLASRQHDVLMIKLWLMSCRVLKRDMEIAMLDALAARAQELGVTTLRGLYLPTKKNGPVKDHYDRLGFTLEDETADGARTYRLDIRHYKPANIHIRVLEPANAPA
jgi:FkbH-like protein